MFPHLSRRRFIGITAAAAGVGLVPSGRPAGAGTHLVT
jgi:FAD:protein FMN transferase